MRWSAVVIACGVVGIACSPDRPADPGSPSGSAQQPMVFETELMVDVKNNGAHVGSDIILTPADPDTWGRLLDASEPGGFDNEQFGQTGTGGFSGGWYDPIATDGGCRPDQIEGEQSPSNADLVARYLDGLRTLNGGGASKSEVHPPIPNVLEGHCIRPGRYTFSAGGQTFVIEYIAPETDVDVNGNENAVQVTHEGTSLIEFIEADGYNVHDDYTDFGVTVEMTDQPAWEAPVLEIDKQASNARNATTFSPLSAVKAQSTNWIRFSTKNSTTNFPAVNRALFLSRLFYDYGVDPLLRTEYYDVTGSGGIIRAHKYQNVTGTRCVIVGYEMKLPDELPSNLADATRQVAISPDGMWDCPAGPDLMPMPKSMSVTSVNAGGVVTVAFREHNVGSTAVSSSWNGQIYLSADATCCSVGQDQGVATFSGSSINAGSYVDLSLPVTIPVGTASGTYYVFAKLDDGSSITESDETNNAKAQVEQLTVSTPPPPPPPPVPDLTPTPVTFTPSSVEAGGGITVTVREQNNGNASAASGWLGKIHLSSDNTCCTGDVQLDSYTETNIIGGGTYTDRVRPVTVPAGTTPGTYYIFASLDVNSQISESNEANNVAPAATTLLVTPRACASFEKTTTWKMADQIFNAGCSSTGPNIQYRWQTTTGGPWSAYSTSTQYEFMGHATSGTYSVTVEAKDMNSGAFDTTKYTFSVQNLQLTITGPTIITVKQSYTYTASTSSTWWERLVPNTTWIGPLVTSTTWNRVWNIGCYDMDVRADATSGGSVLKRGRKLVHVMIEPNCAP